MRRARSVLVLTAVLATALAVAGPAAADRPRTDVLDTTMVDCYFETESGFVGLSAGLESFNGEPSGWVEVFAELGDDFVHSDWDYLFEFTEADFSADLSLISEMLGEVVGEASVAGTYEQVGDLELVEEWRTKLGNEWQEGRIHYAPVAIAGSLDVTVDGLAPMSFDLAGCWGTHLVEEVWHTSPQAFVLNGTDSYFFCELEWDGWFAGLFGAFGDLGEGLDLQAFGPEAEYYGFLEDPDLGLGANYLEVDLWEPMEDEPSALATIDATFSKGALFDVEAFFQDGYQKVEECELLIEGSLTLPGDVVFDLSACEGRYADIRVFVNENESNGKGKAPANDLPEGAIKLDNRDSVHTRMAAEEPEAACSDPEWGEIPLGRTVWYTVAGTGEEVTVDTAGSDFDTVMSVFLMENDALIPIACIDDVWDEFHYTNLAALTWDTTEEKVYYVEIAGFDGQYGHLKVAVDW